MKLDGTTRKQIKKLVKEHSLSEVASLTHADPEDIVEYLEHRWQADKLDKYLQTSQYKPTPKANPFSSPSESTAELAPFMTGAKLKMMSFWRWLADHWLYILLLFILVGAIYYNSLDNEFVSDDVEAIASNPNIGNLNFALRQVRSAAGDLSRYLIYHYVGNLPVYYRIDNIIFHFLNCVLVYYLVSMLTNKRVGLLSALLFAVHPLQTEAVTWISGGRISHSAFFILLSLILYLKFLAKEKLHWTYFAAILAFLLALMFSEKNMGYPLVLFVLLLSLQKLKKYWASLIPFFILTGLWAMMYAGMISQRMTDLNVEFSAPSKINNPLMTWPTSLTSYWNLMVWPRDLTLYHTQYTIGYVEYAIRATITAIIVGLILYSLKRDRRYFFWFAFFFMVLSPTMTPYGVASLVAERYVYLAALGCYVIFGLLVDRFLANKKTQNIAVGLLFILLLGLMARTYQRNQEWQNAGAQWLATEKVSPNSPQNNNNLGDYYTKIGDIPKAIQHFQRAIELNPGYAHAYHNLANIYARSNQLDLAEENYRKAITFNPYQWQSYQELALVLYIKKDYVNSLKYLKAALAINPNNEMIKKYINAIEIKLKEK